MKKSQDWAIRLTNEAKYHEQNIFITLTFDNVELAKRDNPGSLDVTEVQRFTKRLRKQIQSKRETQQTKIRYYAVGEYGEKTGRPHYHILLFGWQPHDGTLFKTSPRGSKLYNSALLTKLWPYGYINYGEVTWDSASYCAGYITKKFNNNSTPDRLTWNCPLTGRKIPKRPEFALCSRNPPLGFQWLYDNYEELLRDDYIVVKGKKRSLPAAYDRWLEENHPEQFQKLKDKRLLEFMKTPSIDEDRRIDMHLAKWHHHTQRLRSESDDGNDDLYDFRQQGTSVPKAILHAQRRNRRTSDQNDYIS